MIRICIALAVWPMCLMAVEEKVIPEAFPPSRYEASWSKNPFLLKTAPVTQPTVSFAQDWVISGMYRAANKTVVTLMNRQTGERKRVTSDDADSSEFRLVKANIAPRTSDSSAVIAKGNEEAELKYDDQLLARPLTTPKPAPIAQAMNGARPGTSITPQQAQANARAAAAAARGATTAGRPAGGSNGGPIVVGQQPGQVARNNVGANGLPPGVILPGAVPGTGTNNGVTVDLTGGNNSGSNSNPTVNTGDGTAAPATVTRRRRLIPASALNNP